mgnify:CR=1 FL=1
MSNRTPHGDDWLSVLGGLLFAIIAFAWALLQLVFRVLQWVYRRIKNRSSE